MTNEQIKYSIQTGDLKLGTWGKLTHYGIVLICFLIPATIIFLYLNDHLEGKLRPLQEGLIWYLIIPPILGILFYRIQKKRLKFKTIDTQLAREQLDLIIEKVANELEWIPIFANEKVIVAKTSPGFFSGSWGEQITILFDDKRILVNSICDPDKQSSLVSMGRNKKNMNRLIEAIKKTGS
jgi:hypothetical protein